MLYRSTHIAANGIISFFLIAKWYSIVYMHHIFIHSSINEGLCCFCVLAIVNSAALNVRALAYFQIMFFSRNKPRNGIAQSYVALF